MPSDIEPSRETQQVLALPPSLDIAAADALLQTLRATLAAGPVLLDASAVERASVPCLQVLAAACAAARDQGQALRLVGSTPALAMAIADLGLAVAIPMNAETSDS